MDIRIDNGIKLIDILIAVADQGGVESQIKALAKYCRSRNIRIRVVQMVWEHHEWAGEDIEFHAIYDDRNNQTTDTFYEGYKSFLQDHSKPDMIIAAVWPLMCPVARRAVQDLGLSVRIASWLHAPLERYKAAGYGDISHLKYADLHFVISEQLGREILETCPNAIVYKVNNAYAPDRMHELPRGDERTLLYVGRLSEEKNVALILRALARVKDLGWKLKIIGDGDARGALEDLSGRLGISDIVQFAGWMREPWAEVKEASALVLSSLYEGVPVVAIEALASSIPVISTDVGFVSEVVKDTENGFLFPDRSEDGLVDILKGIGEGGLRLPDPGACRKSVAQYEEKHAYGDFYRKILATCYDRILPMHMGNVGYDEAEQMISVIIPCYNAENVISDCLDSILNQSIGRYLLQIILVNDVSTDRTPEILLDYERRFPDQILVINCEEKVLAGGARNTALSYVQTGYVAFVDADDLVAEDYLEKLYLGCLVWNADIAECGSVIFSDRENVSLSETVSMENEVLTGESILQTDAEKKKHFADNIEQTAPWRKLYKSVFLKRKNILFSENCRMGEDVLFSAVALAECKIHYYVHKDLYYYYLNEEGITRSESRSKYCMDLLKAYEDMISELTGRGMLELYKEGIYGIWNERINKDLYSFLSAARDLRSEDISAYQDRIKHLTELYFGKEKINYRCFRYKGAVDNNDDIADCNADWICFCRSDRIDDNALGEILSELDRDGFGGCVFSGDDQTITDGVSMLGSFRDERAGFAFKKEILFKTGRFNEYLGDGADLELLCRLADMTKIRRIPKQWVILEEGAHNPEAQHIDYREYSETLAYLCCRYQTDEKTADLLNEKLALIVNDLKARGVLQDFLGWLQEFTQNADIYKRVVRDTAPVFIISGDDTAYGVLRDFARELARSLVKQGQAVITTDGEYVPYTGVEDIENRDLKAVIGFQAPILFRTFFKNMDALKFQFWFDDPVFFNDVFQQIEGEDRYFILCQDGYHAQHLREHYHILNAVHFSPGSVVDRAPDFENRDLDLVFIGTYSDPDSYRGKEMQEGFAKEYIDYMSEHPDRSYEQGVKDLLAIKGIEGVSHNDYMKLLWSLANVYRYIRACFRKKVIEEIAGSGLKLHVYGESWKGYEGNGKENLILHPALDPEGVKDVLRRAKISLNIMSWHKDGWTERVVESMMSGCVCVTDQTACMNDKFGPQSGLDCPKEKLEKELIEAGIARFELEEVTLLPEMIKRLLADDALRKSVAGSGYRYAVQNETWDVRAYEMLRMAKLKEETTT